jgi:uncharacterized membrane protein
VCGRIVACSRTCSRRHVKAGATSARLHPLPAHRRSPPANAAPPEARGCHKAIAATLALAGLFVLPFRPLVALILFAAAIAVVGDRRAIFGSGMFRAILAFVSALWLALLGVVVTLLGMASTDPGGNFLLLPGLLILGLGLALLVWSITKMWRIRRTGFTMTE